MSTFKSVHLYRGEDEDEGAIVVELPDGFADFTTVRSYPEVPDNQELYVEKDGDTSVIFSILEHVDQAQAATDEEALKFHYTDMISGPDDTTQFWHSNVASLSRMPNTPAYTLLATQHPAPNAVRKDADFTAIVFILIRLAQQKTDIVITINVPHKPGKYVKEDVDFSRAKQGPLMDAAEATKQRILQTFEIKNWSLFINED